jgi:hypothetical protein
MKASEVPNLMKKCKVMKVTNNQRGEPDSNLIIERGVTASNTLSPEIFESPSADKVMRMRSNSRIQRVRRS